MRPDVAVVLVLAEALVVATKNAPGGAFPVVAAVQP
jgi:hypothetical protein